MTLPGPAREITVEPIEQPAKPVPEPAPPPPPAPVEPEKVPA